MTTDIMEAPTSNIAAITPPESQDNLQAIYCSLSLRDRNIVDAYLECGSQSEAAKKCGYKGKHGRQSIYQTLQKASVARYIELSIEEAARKQRITPDGIRRRIDDIAISAKSASDRLRALELLGKSIGMFTDANAGGDSVVLSVIARALDDARRIRKAVIVDVGGRTTSEEADVLAAERVDDKILDGGDGAGGPHPTLSYSNTLPQKIAEQIPTITTVGGLG